MNKIIKYLLEFADRLGVISCLNCYDTKFMTVEGITHEGREFTITLKMEEKTDA